MINFAFRYRSECVMMVSGLRLWQAFLPVNSCKEKIWFAVTSLFLTVSKKLSHPYESPKFPVDLEVTRLSIEAKSRAFSLFLLL